MSWNANDVETFESTAVEMETVASQLASSLVSAKSEVVPLCKSFVVHSKLALKLDRCIGCPSDVVSLFSSFFPSLLLLQLGPLTAFWSDW